jgi:hypothetical protein
LPREKVEVQIFSQHLILKIPQAIFLPLDKTPSSEKGSTNIIYFRKTVAKKLARVSFLETILLGEQHEA